MAPLDDIDLSDLDLFQYGDPHKTFRLLRREAPVFWNRERSGPGFWVLTKYEDLISVFSRPEVFSSERGSILGPYRGRRDPAAGKMLVMTDPPRHRALRHLLSRGFTPRMVGRLEKHMRETVEDILERSLEEPLVDFASDIAAKLPVAMICEMMGVPREDWNLMLRLTSTAFGSNDHEFQSAESSHLRSIEAHSEILSYYSRLVDQRRREPRDDLVTVLVTSSIDGVPLTDEEILLSCDNLISGGNETTRHAATGGMLALIENPQARVRLISDPSLIGPAVEEILRWTSPGLHVLRTATEDVIIRGQLVRAGEEVTLWMASANYDEEVFSEPQRFDINRINNRHLTFGTGEHVCIGAALARLELRVLFQGLLSRVSEVELVGSPERVRSNHIYGIKHLPVILRR